MARRSNGPTPRTALVAVLAAAVAGGAGISAANAGSDRATGPRSPGDIHCTGDYEPTLTPGLSLSPSTGTFSTGGETGTLVCEGTIRGRQITGPGTFGESGRYGMTGASGCTNPFGTGDLTTSVTLPTSAGPVHITTAGTMTYGLLQGGGLIGGTKDGDRIYGGFSVLPEKGDCVTAPITRVRSHFDGWLSP